jgi:hypothetical protein
MMRPAWCDRDVADAPDTRSDLASVLRRLATEPRFVAAVTADPTAALASYTLTGDDLAALALWLDQPATGEGFDALFEGDARPPS